jgi:hypothetical protein
VEGVKAGPKDVPEVGDRLSAVSRKTPALLWEVGGDIVQEPAIVNSLVPLNKSQLILLPDIAEVLIAVQRKSLLLR